MSRIPKEQWERLQLILQNRTRGGFPSGGPRGFGAGAGLILLGIGGWAISNSLYNGEHAHEAFSCLVY